MSYNEKTAERERLVLSRRAFVLEKKIFGGLCFMVNGHMCCGLTSTAFMVRVGLDRYEEALAQPHARPMDFTGRPLAGMVYVDPAGYKTDGALTKWIQQGLDYISTLPVREPATKARKPRRKRAKKASVRPSGRLN